jgi:hypothetical protein
MGVALAAMPAAKLRAQQFAPTIRTAVVPDTIHVGDVITAAIRITVPAGATVTFPDSLTLPLDLENAGDRVLKADTTPNGIQLTATYRLAAWRPGAHMIDAVPVTVNGAQMNAVFDSVRIASVLPGDTTGIGMKPLKAVIGGVRVWWPWIVALLLLLALLLLYWLSRRRDRVEVAPVVPARPARDVALERLDEARTSGVLERGDVKEFYSAVSDALRAYVAAVDPLLSADLTTSEVAGRIRARGVDPAGAELLTLMGASDLVKFARRTPRTSEAHDEWLRIRKWVADTRWPPVDESADAGSAQEAA